MSDGSEVTANSETEANAESKTADTGSTGDSSTGDSSTAGDETVAMPAPFSPDSPTDAPGGKPDPGSEAAPFQASGHDGGPQPNASSPGPNSAPGPNFASGPNSAAGPNSAPGQHGNDPYSSGPSAPGQNSVPGQYSAGQGSSGHGGQWAGPGSQQGPQRQQQPGQQPGPYQGAPQQSGPDQFGPAQYQSSQHQAAPGGQAPYAMGPQTGSGPGSNQAIPQPAPAPGFAGAGAAATRAEARPTKKRSKLPLFIALGSVLLVLVLVLVGFLVVNSVNKNDYGPDTVAQDYVAALNQGDFAAAEKIAPSPRPEGTNLDLLSQNFTDASQAKIENAKVESAEVDGDNGTVVVSYDLDGSTYNVNLPATKDGKQNLFFDKWTLTGPALHVISLDVPGSDGLTINGSDYRAQAGTTAFAVYPGNYAFTIPASKWVSEASDTAAANFPQAYSPGDQPSTDQVAPLTLNLDLAPTPDFEKEVQKQVEEELKKCFDTKEMKPKCDFIKYDPTEIPISGSDKTLDEVAKKGTAKWDVKKMPKVSAAFGDGDSSTGSFFTETTGEFNFSVEAKDQNSTYFANDNPLSVSGSVNIDGDKLSVEFFDF